MGERRPISMGDYGGYGAAEEEDEEFENTGLGQPAIIFLVDCRSGMVDQHPSLLQQCLGTIASFCRDSVVTDNKQKIGVCLFGTEIASNPNDFPNVFVLYEAEVPDTKENKELLDLAAGKGFERFGHIDSKVAFHHALWVCSTMFSSCTGKVVEKEIFVLTSDPDPTRGDATLTANAMKKAKDLSELAMKVQVYPVTPIGTDFDNVPFYQPLLDAAGMTDALQTSTLEELTQDIKIKSSKQRAACHAMLKIGTEVCIGVELFVHARKATAGTAKYTEKTTNREVKTTTKYISSTSARVLEPSEISAAMPFADGYADFNEDELRSVKSCGEEGIVVLGFRPKDSLPIEHHIRPSHFVYPSEKLMKGSTLAFAALHKRMLARDVLAIGAIRTSTKAALRLAALVPQAADADCNVPAGFNAIYLPYRDDLRSPKVDVVPAAVSESQVSAAEAMLNTFQHGDLRDKSVVIWENPALQKHYAVLEAMALGIEPRVTEIMAPPCGAIEANKSALQEFISTVYGMDYDPDAAKTTGTKRKAAEEVNIDDFDWNEMVKSGSLKKRKVSELKAFCALKNISNKGKKDELLERVTAFIEQNP